MPSNATMTGAEYNATGKFGQSLNAGYGTAASLPAQSAFTAECWVKSTSTATVAAMAQLGIFWFGMIGGKATFTLEAGTQAQRTSNVAINDGAWHHLELDVGSSGSRLFVGGVLAISDGGDTISGSADWSANQLNLGNYGGSAVWPGEIDEMAVWSGVRHTAAFTPPTSAYTGAETNLLRLYHLDGTSADAAGATPPLTGLTIGRNNAAIFYAPYVWNDDGTSANANSTGAYLEFAFTGTSIALNTVALAGGQSAYPKIRALIDDLAPVDIQLSAGSTSYPIVTGLAAGTHKLRLATVAFDQSTGYWVLDAALKVASFVIDAGATVSATSRRSKRAIFYGDSYIQGDTVHGAVPGVAHQDGTLVTAPFIAEALDAELGQVGFGGQGFNQGGGGGVPALSSAMGLKSSGVSRLVGGVLSPAPDYVFCQHGGNGTSTQAQVASIIAQLRSIAPTARIMMIVHPGGYRRAEVTAATNAAIGAGDTRLSLVDCGPAMQVGLDGATGANYWNFDGVHPNPRANAKIAARISALTQRAIEPRRFTVVAG